MAPTKKGGEKKKTPKNVRKKKNSKENNAPFSQKKRTNKSRELQYTPEMMLEAVNAVGSGKTLKEISNEFGVPKSTLYRKAANITPLNCRKGPPTVLTAQEESDVEKWIITCAERGFPVSKDTLLDYVQKFLNKEKRTTAFTNQRPGKHWFRGFMKRHKQLSTRIAQNLTVKRAIVSETQLKAWFSDVEKKFKEKGVKLDNPDQIFNLDESSFQLVPKDEKVIGEKGAVVKKIVSNNEKSCITVLFTASAAGKIAPPMVLFNLKNPPKKNVLESIPKDWGVGYSDKGWMTSETFYSYIVNIFYPWLKSNYIDFPIVLFVDNHASHLSLPLLRFCEQNKIELTSLYPNSTHIIQPLDVSFFHPLKEAYKRTLRKWRIENEVIQIQKSDFSQVLKLSLDSQDFSKTIRNGFSACGLYPFNSETPNYKVLGKKRKKNSSMPETNDSSQNNVVTLPRDMNQDHLQHLESQLPASIVESFQSQYLTGMWSGDLSYKALFEYWCTL